MSPPPTNIDGTDITGASIDGQEVQEITIDGQTVFSAAPDLAGVVLNASAENYDGTKYVSSVGPNIPDAGGSPSIVSNAINGFDAVQYNGGSSRTNTTIATSTSIAIVSTFKKSNLNDNAVMIDDPADFLTFGLNDDSGGSDYLLFIEDSSGTQQKLFANYSSFNTNYHVHAFGIGSELFFSQDGSTKASDSSVTQANPLDGFEIGFATMQVAEISVLDNFSATELNDEITRQRNKYNL